MVAALFFAALEVQAGQVTVWLDDGTQAPGTTNTEQPFNNDDRDISWDITATAQNGLADVGAAIMTVRMLTIAYPTETGSGVSRTPSDGFGFGLAVTGLTNDRWLDGGEGAVFQFTFYADAAKTIEVTGLNITFESLVARMAGSLGMDVFAGSGAVVLTGSTDNDDVTLAGTQMKISNDSVLSFSSETGLVPTNFTSTGYYTVSGNGTVVFDENDTFWVRRPGDGTAAYQLGGITFEVTEATHTYTGEGSVTVYLDDGSGLLAESSNGTRPYSVSSRDTSWDISSKVQTGLAEIGAAVMTVRMLPIAYPLAAPADGVSRTTSDGFGFGMAVTGLSNDRWMDAGEGAVFQFSFYADEAKTTEIHDVQITLNSLVARMTASLDMNVFAGSGAIALGGNTDADNVTLGGNVMTIANDSVLPFVSQTGLVPTNFTETGYYMISSDGTVSFDETDAFWMRRSSGSGAYQLGGIAFTVKVQNTYDTWANFYGLQGGPSDDDDQDGLSNIHEYGVGGDPTDAQDQGISPEFSVMSSGGSNVFSYVYPQRSGSGGELTYCLELNTDLISGTWTNFGYSITGTNVTGDTFDFVTNTTDMVEDQKFIRLVVEKVAN